MKSSKDGNAAPIVIFDKTEVEYRNDGWYYDNTSYWFPKYEHSFVAICPLSVLETGNNPRYSNSRLSFTYTIPTSGGTGDASDIIAATHRRFYDLPEDSFVIVAKNRVTLKFAHILSLINFAPALNDNIMDEDEYIMFHKMELSGVKTKAEFNILPASRQSNDQTDDMVIDVTGHEGGETDFTIGFAEPIKVVNGRENVSFEDKDAIIMLPQTFAADSDAKITFYYTVNDGTTIKQIYLPLKNMQKWEPGKRYTYKFTIDRTGLHSEETTITDWEALDAGNINAR